MIKKFSISTGSIEEPDISVTPRIPVVNEKLKIFAKVRGNTELIPVKFVFITPDGTQIILDGRAETFDTENGFVDYACEWTPSGTGFHRLQVEIHPPNTDAESVEIVFPVVWTRMHVLSWHNPESCRWVGTGVYVPEDETAFFPYWRRRGSKVLGLMHICVFELCKLSREEIIKTVVSRAETIAGLGYDGILIDELGSYANESRIKHVAILDEAFQIVNKRFPDLQVYNWTSGGMLREEACMAQKNGHVLMTEIYAEHLISNFGTHSFPKHLEHRFEVIRNSDALFNHNSKSCAIAALGVGGVCGSCQKPVVEERIRMIKRIAPEAPGICYYPGGPAKKYWNDKNFNYQAFLDELFEKYFINPVIMLRESAIMPKNSDFKAKQLNKIIVQVHNCGGMKAKNIRINLSARHLKTNVVQDIAVQVIPEISNGIIKKERLEFDGDEYFDTVKINETTYPISWPSESNYRPWGNIYADRALVEFEWKPDKSGYWEILAEVIPDGNYTVLDGTWTLIAFVNEK
jgi:hypothetical protein